MLPTATQFAEQVGALGVGNDSTVVVYDGSGANLSAGRVWWMFRALATIGSRYWTAAAKVEGGGKGDGDGNPACRARGLHREASPGVVRTIDDVADALRSGSAQVVDMRSRGGSKEPTPSARVPA
jgi:thiosulfate/3-mercaptopyruvate sulfurtransferase